MFAGGIIASVLVATFMNGFGGTIAGEYLLHVWEPFALQLLILIASVSISMAIIFITVETEYIFDRFYTIDAARTNKNTGLGLAIVKGLVEGMGGSVSASVKNDLLSIQLHLEKAKNEKVVL